MKSLAGGRKWLGHGVRYPKFVFKEGAKELQGHGRLVLLIS